MKRWIIFSLLFLLSINQSNALSEQDKISDISKRISNFIWCKVDFSQEKKISALRKPLHSKGELIVLKGKGVQWTITSPIESKVVLTSEGVFGDKGEGRVERLTPKDTPLVQAFMRALMDALSGDLPALEQVFHVSLKEEKARWELSLEPKDKTLQGFLKSMILQGNDAIEKVSIEETNGDLTFITYDDPQRFQSEPAVEIQKIFSHLPS